MNKFFRCRFTDAAGDGDTPHSGHFLAKVCGGNIAQGGQRVVREDRPVSVQAFFPAFPVADNDTSGSFAERLARERVAVKIFAFDGNERFLRNVFS